VGSVCTLLIRRLACVALAYSQVSTSHRAR
jgi:hypothetical protein